MVEIKLHTKFYSGKDVHDLIIRHLSNDYHAALAAIRELSNIPAADVVEVVRCKDCDLWNEWNKAGHEQTGNYVCSCAYFSNEDGYMVYTRPDDYCSRGERKEAQGGVSMACEFLYNPMRMTAEEIAYDELCIGCTDKKRCHDNPVDCCYRYIARVAELEDEE